MRLFILSLLIGIAWAEDLSLIEKAKLRIISDLSECSSTTGAGPADVSAALARKVPKTHEGQCMIACVLQKNQFQDEAGNLTFEKGAAYLYDDDDVKNAFPSDWLEKTREFGRQCAEEVKQDDDACAVASNYLACGINKGTEAGLKSVNDF